MTEPNKAAAEGVASASFAAIFYAANSKMVAKIYKSRSYFVKAMTRSKLAMERKYRVHLASKSLHWYFMPYGSYIFSP